MTNNFLEIIIIIIVIMISESLDLSCKQLRGCLKVTDKGGENFPLASMGARAEGLACVDPGARTEEPHRR